MKQGDSFHVYNRPVTITSNFFVMRISIFKVLVFLIFLSGFFTARAQFQGHIVMNLYSDNEGVKETNVMNMYVTGDRIMIQGDDKVQLQRGLNAQGLLIRHDKKDFVVLTGEKDALQVTKSDIESMMQMASAFERNKQSSTPNEIPKANYRYTDRTKTILGYECAEMIVNDKNSDDVYLSVWLTSGIDINWGMLAEPWKNLSPDMQSSFRVPQEAIFTGDTFPLLIEKNDKGTLTKVAEVTKLERSSIAKAMVELPQGVNLIGFGDFMFRMMMEN